MSNTDRSQPEAMTQSDPDSAAQAALFRSFIMTVQHFFGGFKCLFQGLTDRRKASHITYPLPVLMVTGVLMFLFRLRARRQISQLLRQNGASAAKFQTLFEVPDCPHGDTVNYGLARSEVAEGQEVVTRMVETLIRCKMLYRYRLLGRYYLLVIDGTGMLTFRERHCPYCMTRTYHGQIPSGPGSQADHRDRLCLFAYDRVHRESQQVP